MPGFVVCFFLLSRCKVDSSTAVIAVESETAKYHRIETLIGVTQWWIKELDIY